MTNKAPTRAGTALTRLRPPEGESGPDKERPFDRRISPRAELKFPVHLDVPSVGAAIDSKVLNISNSGMFIAMDEPAPIGSRLDVEVSLEGGQMLLHATVEVARQRTREKPRGVGVRFLDVSFEAQALIDHMIQDHNLFGHYRIEAVIGSGGMADVYRARCLGGPNADRTVAIKRIRDDLVHDPTMVDLFLREAEIGKSLQHPHVAKLFEAGSVGKAFYIAMEYVRGVDLEGLLAACVAQKIEMPVDFACYVAHVVADALHFVHSARDSDGKAYGIVHRDVAPSNIFISDLGEIKLGDFGVAFAASAPSSDNAIVGKTHYMAPEQTRGGRVTPAVDVFALGAVLYELLTLRRAFPGTKESTVWRKIRSGDVHPPSTYRPQISPKLDALVMRALSPRLANGREALVNRVRGKRFPPRFASAEEMAQQLQAHYDPAIGDQLAIAAVVRGLLRHRKDPA